MTVRHCAGCGRAGARVDSCPTCQGRRRVPPPAAPRAPQPSAEGRTSTQRWTLTFVPFGTEVPKVLHRHLDTAEAGYKLADTFNRLEWQEHAGLGRDGLIALGRTGSFILEPVAR